MKLVITGTSSGIGKTLTLALLNKGHEVWGIARSDQSEIKNEYPALFHFSACDISVWESLDKVSQDVSKLWPSIDAIITCAGIQGEVGRTLFSNPLNWDHTVRANLQGTFHTLRAFNSLLEKTSRRGKIICFSGGGATKARPNFSAYGSAKTAIVRLVETIAEEEKDRALDINAIAPGAINTRLLEEVLALGRNKAGDHEYAAALKQKAEGGQSITKVIELVEWLLSQSSDHISGRLLSAQWDSWNTMRSEELNSSEQHDLYTLRRKTLT
jgi:3-oxoacyl-[acyl-carrier protein] reductase